MCNRPISWVQNESAKGGVGGTHNMRPVMCDEYVAALEQTVRELSWVAGLADNAALERIQKSFGMTRSEGNDS